MDEDVVEIRTSKPSTTPDWHWSAAFRGRRV